ncbi:MAG: class I SAM-dependent methyltransferase [Chloroflexi bacterium]|nr:class I SAM-dependent methyltransferase [Chloroflexota bacterium]
MKDAHLPSLPSLQLLSSTGWADYTLLDSGGGFKLEQFGNVQLIRPESEAIWHPALPEGDWKKADALYKPSPEENGGHWEYRKSLPERWIMKYKDISFWVMTSASRHLGVFPEQSCQWDWADHVIQQVNQSPKVLNLFGYTGIASLAAAQSGAAVTHLDASRKVVLWAKDNQVLSKMQGSPIRWIIDDATKFVQRELRRGARYDGIILDPPKFGRGPKGEVWEFYKLLPDLLESCRQILSPDPLFIQLTAYAVKASSATLYFAIQEMMAAFSGTTSAGEIGLTEQSAGRFLSTAVFARWCRSDIQP